MARPGVTYFEVSNAAQQLVAAGKRPTIETIRIVLGTGSNSTLGAHLRNWKAAQDKTQQVATKENIPAELIASLKGLWERVMEQSEEKIQIIQNETQRDLSALKDEIKRLQHDIAHWQQQFQQIKHEKNSLVNVNSAIEQMLASTKIEIATLIEKISSCETQNQEKQTQIASLNRQNHQTQANLEHYRTASLEQRLADQLRYEQLQKQLEATVNQSTVWQQKSQHLDFENNNIRLQLETIVLQHETITKHLNETSSELTSKTQEQQHWQTQYCALQSKCDSQNASIIELQTQNAILLQKFETINAELKIVIEQNKVLIHEKFILGQEKAQLYGQFKQLELFLSKHMPANI